MYTWQSNWVLAISTASFHVQITSLSVISTVLLRQTLFKDVRYGGRGVVGIALCLVGAFLWLRDETIDSRQQEMSIGSVLLGDLLACGAAFLYGLNDVVAEYYVKSPSCDPEEYLGMLGLFGSLLSFGLQVPIMENTTSLAR